MYQAQEHEIASLKEDLKEAIQLISGMKQEEKNLKEQLQEKEECCQKKELEIMSLQEELEQSGKSMTNLKHQSEEDKKIKENMTIQLLKKEDSCHMLELEVEDLRKKYKNENAYIKFKDNSKILYKILYSQRSPTDKYCLGFNNTVGEIKNFKKTPSWKYDMDIPSSTRQSEAIDREHVQYPNNK